MECQWCSDLIGFLAVTIELFRSEILLSLRLMTVILTCIAGLILNNDCQLIPHPWDQISQFLISFYLNQLSKLPITYFQQLM